MARKDDIRPMGRDGSWGVLRLSDGVHHIYDKTVRTGWERYVLLRSDAHMDSTANNWAMEKRHLDLALERDAIILDGGDLFDLMQGPGDKRGRKGQLHDKYLRDDYFNAVMEDAVKRYRPYASQWAVQAYGNHETAAIRHYGFDILRPWAHALGVSLSGYQGWISFLFTRNATRSRHKLFHHHGAGGNSPVTLGVIGTNRRQVWVRDADVIWTGHVHQMWHVIRPAVAVSDQGRVRHTATHHISTPGYKRADELPTQGWEVEKGFAPTPIGAYWLRFYFECADGRDGVKVEVTSAT